MEVIILIIAGFLGGILASLLGLGGGLAIVPALMICLPFYQVDSSVVMHLSVGTSLLIMLVNSVASAWSHHQARNIDWLLFGQILPFVVVGTLTGCFVAIQLPTQLLIFIFLVFLLVIIVRFLSHFKKRKPLNMINTSRPPMIAKGLSGVMSGLIGSCMGVGSSLILVPVLKRYGFYIRHCAGLSNGFNVLIALIAIFYYSTFNIAHEPFPNFTTGYIFWPVVIWLFLGSVVGVPFGTWLGRQLTEKITTFIYFSLLLAIFFIMLYKFLRFII